VCLRIYIYIYILLLKIKYFFPCGRINTIPDLLLVGISIYIDTQIRNTSVV
jgi:hypothetical protein